jgi:F0F1-type ATP synthase assembly protein I
VNIAAAGAMGAFAGAFTRRIGLHALWGVIVPLYPGFVLTFSRDLAEIVAAAFAMGAIWAISARHDVTAALLLTCAVLAREPALLLAFALAGAWLVERLLRRERHVAPVVFATPIVVYVFWQVFLTVRWGVSPLRSGAPAMVLPFVEFARFFAASAARRYHQQRLYFTECVFLVSTVITAVLVWRRTRAPLEWYFAWLGYLALAAVLPRTIWLEDFGFLRIFADLFLVSAVLIIASTRSARWFTLLTTASLWYYIAKDVVSIG